MKKTLPTVSILLSNYNNSNFLYSVLFGFLNQTKCPDEIIIVDDGSTDSSMEVINKVIGNYKHVKIIKNEKNIGLIPSINKALYEAKGDYIVWAASDDLLLPNFLEKSLNTLSQYPDAGLCFSQFGVFVNATSQKRLYNPNIMGPAFDLGSQASYLSSKQLYKRLRKNYLWISGNTALVNRKYLIESGGFKEKLKWHADWFAFYMVAIRYGVCVIPEVLTLMRELPESYSRNNMNKSNHQRKVLDHLISCVEEIQDTWTKKFFKRTPSLFSPFGFGILNSMIRQKKLLMTIRYFKFCLLLILKGFKRRISYFLAYLKNYNFRFR